MSERRFSRFSCPTAVLGGSVATEKGNPPRLVPATGQVLVQLRFATGLSSEAYVSEQGWKRATLDRCPLHPAGGCGFRRHGTYARKMPTGTRIARWYCRLGQTTFSLIPDCLASQVSGGLEEIEAAVRSAAKASSLEAATELRPDIELPGALRWLRRRIEYVRSALVVARGLAPDVLAGSMPVLREVSAALRIERCVLVRLRAELVDHLASIAAPLGFSRRSSRRERARDGPQQSMGPVPKGTGA